VRVLAVTNIFPTADRPYVGTFVAHQVEGLRRIGVEVDVLYLDRLREGMQVYFRAGERVRKQIESNPPDLVHVMYGGVMAWQVIQAVSDRPVVVTFHNSDVFGENLSGLARRLISRVGVWCSRAAAKKAARVILVSRHLTSALPPGLDPAKLALIPCGIDLSRFSPRDREGSCERLGWNPASFNILFPSNMGDPRKRPELARAAVDLLRADEIPADLKLLKGVAYDDVPVWMNACDVHLLTSLEEGSPTTIKEALACNRPVVSVDVGDVAERIEGIEGCYLAEPNPRDLAAKLRIVWQDRGAIRGRDAMSSLSIENIAESLSALYNDCLEGRAMLDSSRSPVQG
jgi:glycosyltransferase involved in cell wall biosynthesis